MSACRDGCRSRMRLRKSSWSGSDVRYTVSRSMRGQPCSISRHKPPDTTGCSCWKSATATTYGNMAFVYKHQGEYEKALEWYEKGLEIKLKTLGPDHPDTATTYFNLGVLYHNMKDYKTSLENLELALAIYLKSFGPTHPHISSVKSWIAGVKKKM